MKVQSTGMQQFSKHMKVLIAGANGSGRLRVAATFPDPFVISMKANLMSIADRGIPFTEVESEADLGEIIRVLRDNPALIRSPVQTVILSSIDELQRIIMFERLRAEKKAVFAMSDWQWLGQKTQNILTAFTSLKMNVVLITHVKNGQDELGDTHIEPALQGSVNNYLGQYVDYAFLLKNYVTKNDEGKDVRYRFLQSVCDDQIGWLKDDSLTLPSRVGVNFQDDYKKLQSYVKKWSGPRTVSVTFEAPRDKTKPTSVIQGQTHVLPSDAKPNVLPNGVVAKDLGLGVNMFCEECGDELDNEIQGDRTYIRSQEVLCKTHERVPVS